MEDVESAKTIISTLLKSEFDHITDPKVKHLIMRLHDATLETELLEKAKLEDDFNKDLDIILSRLTQETEEERRQKELIKTQKEQAVSN